MADVQHEPAITGVRRHGAVLYVADGRGLTPLTAETALTRRGARRAFSRLRGDLPGWASDAGGFVDLVVVRIEQREVVEAVWSGEHGGGHAVGVREPRRPRPSDRSGAAEAAP